MWELLNYTPKRNSQRPRHEKARDRRTHNILKCVHIPKLFPLVIVKQTNKKPKPKQNSFSYVNLKDKSQLFCQQKWVYLGRAKNCHLGHASHVKTTGNSREQKRGTLFYRGKGGAGRGSYKQKVHWSKLGVWSAVAFHGQSCGSFSLPGLLPGKEKIFLLPASKAVFIWSGKVLLFLLVLHLIRSGRARGLPLLASWLHFNEASLP